MIFLFDAFLSKVNCTYTHNHQSNDSTLIFSIQSDPELRSLRTHKSSKLCDSVWMDQHSCIEKTNSQAARRNVLLNENYGLDIEYSYFVIISYIWMIALSISSTFNMTLFTEIGWDLYFVFITNSNWGIRLYDWLVSNKIIVTCQRI